MFPRRPQLSIAFLTALTVTGLLLALCWLLRTPTAIFAQSRPEALGQLSGKVTNNAGDPVAGIVVALEQYTDNTIYPQQSAVSDSSGVYHFAGVFPGIYRVRFSDPNGLYGDRFYAGALMPDDATTVAVSGNNVQNIDIQLVAGNVGAISVTLQSGAPPSAVQSFSAFLYRQADNGRWQVYRKIAQSSPTPRVLELAGLPYGRYRLCAQYIYQYNATAYLCYDNVYVQSTTALIEAATDIVVDQPTPVAVTLNFQAGSQIRGTVLSPNGEPVAGVTVRLMELSFLIVTDVVTDEQGHFFFTGTASGRYWLLANVLSEYTKPYEGEPYLTTFYPDGLDFYHVEELTLDASTYMSVTMQLTAPGQISGKATLPTGDALVNPSFTIVTYRQEQGGWVYNCSFTLCPATVYNQETRTYTMTGIIPGQYRVSAAIPFGLTGQMISGYYKGTEIGNAKDIAVHPGKTLRNIDITIGEGGFDGSISGTVQGDGSPQAGLLVTLYGGSYSGPMPPALLTTTTDSQGHYSLNGLSSGYYAPVFSDPQGRYVTAAWYEQNSPPLFVSGVHPTTNINFDLFSPAGGIRGRIHDPSGKPVAGYHVNVYTYQGVGNSYILYYYDAVTDDRGEYELKGLRPGPYYVSARPSELLPYGYTPERYYPGADDQFNATVVTVTANEVVDDIDISFDRSYGANLPYIRSGAQPAK